MMTLTRVLLADDHALFREGLSGILSAQSDFEIVGQAADGLEAVAKANALKPDLILMDIKMPSCDGLEATRLIKTALPDVKIVVLTVHEENEKLFKAVRSGAEGYVLKNTLPEDFLRLVRGVTEGKAAMTRAMAARILAEFSRLPPPPGHRRRLSAADSSRKRGAGSGGPGRYRPGDCQHPDPQPAYGQNPHAPHSGQAARGQPAQGRRSSHPRGAVKILEFIEFCELTSCQLAPVIKPS